MFIILVPTRTSMPSTATTRKLVSAAARALDFSYGERAALILAVLLGHLFFIPAFVCPLIHDSAGYVTLANGYLAKGLLSFVPQLTEVRTYGYPLFLAIFIRLSEWTGVNFRILVFESQLLLYLLSIVFLRWQCLRAKISPALSRPLFYVCCFNPFIFAYTGYTLTESLSTTLLLLIIGCVVALQVAETAQDHSKIVFTGSLLVGFSIMVRPGNLYLLPAWVIVVALNIFYTYKHRLPAEARKALGLYKALMLIAGVAASTFPQVVSNAIHFNRWTPLIVKDLGTELQLAGIWWLKYATCNISGVHPQVFYFNPWVAGSQIDALHPLRWYWQYPGRGLSTAAVHIFNLVDQDFPFPYTTTLTPGYYPAAAILNHIMVGLGLIGVCLVVRGRMFSDRASKVLAWLLIGLLACYVGPHMWLSVEARYGLVVLLALYGLGVFAATYVVRRASWLSKTVAALFLTGYCFGAAQLSSWVREQAPLIQDAEEERELAQLGPRRPKFESGRLNQWQLLASADVGVYGQARLQCRDGQTPALIVHRAALEKNATYFVEFEARARAQMTAVPLVVSLFGGPEYDKPEHRFGLSTIPQTYQRYSISWNSGADAPPEALLRFFTLSPVMIHIRNVDFRKISAPSHGQ